MATLSEKDRRTRIGFDYLTSMAMARKCGLLQLDAYCTASDLRARRNQINDPADGHRAVHFLATYHPLKTLCGPGQYMDKTAIHIDLLANQRYPYTAPASWVVSDKMPWGPHFKPGTVVCIGDLWDADGTTLLAHLLRHHARLLNWDERARGGGYVGWNGAAIAWHRTNYGTKPLTEGIAYPELPTQLTHGIEEAPAFSVGGRRPLPPEPVASESMFAVQGLWR